jgi:hypothetical protein
MKEKMEQGGDNTLKGESFFGVRIPWDKVRGLCIARRETKIA